MDPAAIYAEAAAWKALAAAQDLYVGRAESNSVRLKAVAAQNIQTVAGLVAANDALAASKAKAASAGTALSPQTAAILQDILTQGASIDALAKQNSSMTTSQILLPQVIKDAITAVLAGKGNIGQLGDLLNAFFSKINTAGAAAGANAPGYSQFRNDIGAMLQALGLTPGNHEFNPIEAPPPPEPPPASGTPLSTVDLGYKSLQELEAALGFTITYTPSGGS